MTVYVVYNSEIYDGGEVHAIFSNHCAAYKYIAEVNYHSKLSVKDWEVDEMVPARNYTVYCYVLCPNGNIRVTMNTDYGTPESVVRTWPMQDGWFAGKSIKSPDDAKAIAMDKRSAWRREKGIGV